MRNINTAKEMATKEYFVSNSPLMAFQVTPLIYSLAYRHKKAQTSVDYSPIEVFALPKQSNKQQETYAGMKTHYTQLRCSMDIIIPIGIY